MRWNPQSLKSGEICVLVIYRNTERKEMEDKRNLNMIFSKNGAGRVSGKINISKIWMDQMGVTEDDKEVIAIFKNDRIIIRRPSKEKKYILVNDQSEANDVIRTELFDTREEANDTAARIWNSLETDLKQSSHVYIMDVKETDLVSDAFDENGDVCNWAFFKGRAVEDGLFDSKMAEIS